MALIDCYECGRQISTAAPACPQCGAPRQPEPPPVAQPPPISQREEEVLHNDHYVKVSTARVIIDGTTYALRNLTSVRMAVTPASVGGAVALLVCGVLMVLVSLGLFSDGENTSAAIICMLIAFGVIALGVWIMRSAKPTYHVAITSSSGELNALSSRNITYIQTVVARINEAIVKHR